jgi:HTH-type transcriptional regulator/antitoxin HigA
MTLTTNELAMQEFVIKPLKNEAEYDAALKVAGAYFNHPPEPNTAEGDQFELLLMTIEAYEAKHHVIDPPDSIEAIKFRMEQAGLTPKDLIPMIGRLNRVYEILTRKRPLTLAMIRQLHHGLGISAQSLIR